jgi:hypothetical protein
MAKMTRERARAWIVGGLRDAMPGAGPMEPIVFNPHGLATDDDETTWADVFSAADLPGWDRKAVCDADYADALGWDDSRKAGAR